MKMNEQESFKYKDIKMYITRHATEKYSEGELVQSTVYEVIFKSVWPVRGSEKMPPPAPEALAKYVAESLAAFLPGTYEIDYWVSERVEPPSETVFGQQGEQIAKILSSDAIPPSPNESEAVKKCREIALGFADRIEAAKTEAERNKIIKEFDKWTASDPTFKGICSGIKRLLQ